MSEKTDNLFSQPKPATPFKFDQQVAEVFPDMIKRSVPGYPLIIEQIQKLAAIYVKQGGNCYDLGCSLGAASLAMSNGISASNAKIIGVDNSQDMLERCRQHIQVFKQQTPIELVCGNIQQVPMHNADMVVINFTLQFIPVDDRQALIKRIYDALNPNGILVLSEKVQFEDKITNDLMIKLHHQFKRENGYSDLEISQKRNALENVLIPDTIETHYQRMHNAGFNSYTTWLQQYNFLSMIAVK
ncbi:carboxy-S-adenosyl-L-methionine synthase CmoA [Aliikangiella sp. IMCC44653]